MCLAASLLPAEVIILINLPASQNVFGGTIYVMVSTLLYYVCNYNSFDHLPLQVYLRLNFSVSINYIFQFYKVNSSDTSG